MSDNFSILIKDICFGELVQLNFTLISSSWNRRRSPFSELLALDRVCHYNIQKFLGWRGVFVIKYPTDVGVDVACGKSNYPLSCGIK